MPDSSHHPAVELIGIDKHFGPVHANRSISLRIERGTVHGIVGENGAGKSTLTSILYGFYQADAGEIRVGGVARRIAQPRDAIAAGIGMVHQHFMLVEPFTALENVVLGAEGGERLGPGISEARTRLEALARDYGLAVPLDTPVAELSVGLRQRIEILKALYRGADILILDEPTGVLTPGEAEHLFVVLRQLRDQGRTVVLITHKLKEVMAVTDRVSVMRRGEMVGTVETKATSPGELAEMMVGRSVRLKVDKAPRPPGRPVLSVRGLSLRDAAGIERLSSISFDVHEGEIVGIAGVAGNGQSELLEVLAGMRPCHTGEIVIGSEPVSGRESDPQRMRQRRAAHVPEDRQRVGLVMPFAATENIILGYQDDAAYGHGPFLDGTVIESKTVSCMTAYDVRPPNPKLRAALFSGGNQQKLVLAREIERDPKLLIVGQPTRGVDIGAIEFIHKRLVAMRDAGKAILLVSVELDEVRALADRILVMFAGRIVGERSPDADEQAIGLLMAGVTADGAAA